MKSTDIIFKIKKQFNGIPAAINYSDLCKFVGKKVGDVNKIDDWVFEVGKALALISPRKRFLITLHRDLKEVVHRMINTFIKGTYAVPHKHTDKSTSENFVVLKGKLCVLEFKDNGEIKNEFVIGDGCKSRIVDIKPGSFHTVLPLTKVVSCFETKGQTNYDPVKDKVFPDWAPKEGDDPKEVKKYLNKLYSALTFK